MGKKCQLYWWNYYTEVSIKSSLKKEINELEYGINLYSFGKCSVKRLHFRFDSRLSQFVTYQMMNLNAPIQVEFSLLPSDELILYVVTDNPVEPLVTLRYEGVSGFVKTDIFKAISTTTGMIQFTTEMQEHFVITQHEGEFTIRKGVFVGRKKYV